MIIEYKVLHHSDGTQYWFVGDKLHNEHGPASVYADGTKFWYIKGEQITEEEFNSRNKVDVKLEEIAEKENVVLNELNKKKIMIDKRIQDDTEDGLEDVIISAICDLCDTKSEAIHRFKMRTDSIDQINLFKTKLDVIWDLKFKETEKEDVTNGADAFLRHLGF